MDGAIIATEPKAAFVTLVTDAIGKRKRVNFVLVSGWPGAECFHDTTNEEQKREKLSLYNLLFTEGVLISN